MSDLTIGDVVVREAHVSKLPSFSGPLGPRRYATLTGRIDPDVTPDRVVALSDNAATTVLTVDLPQGRLLQHARVGAVTLISGGRVSIELALGEIEIVPIEGAPPTSDFLPGDIVTRDGTDEQLVLGPVPSDPWFGAVIQVRCVKAPASGWCAVGDVESNLPSRYQLVRRPDIVPTNSAHGSQPIDN